MAYICPKCPQTFTSEKDLSWHQLRKHEDVQLTIEQYNKLLNHEFAANQIAFTQKENSMPPPECQVCIHNSDARAEAAAALAVAQEKLTDLKTRCETAESALATLQQAPVHPPGFCGHDDCEPCKAEIQGITDSVVPLATAEGHAEGRRAAMTDMRQALIWGSGESFADKVTQIAQLWVQKGRPAPAKEPALIVVG